MPHRALAACGGYPAPACAFRHKFGRGSDASARVGRATLELHRSRPEEFDKVYSSAWQRRSGVVNSSVAVSSYGRSQLYRFVEHRHWPKIQVVHCGLEPAFHAGPRARSAARRLVCVGRLCEQKGQLLLMEAAQRLPSGENSSWCWPAMANCVPISKL